MSVDVRPFAGGRRRRARRRRPAVRPPRLRRDAAARAEGAAGDHPVDADRADRARLRRIRVGALDADLTRQHAGEPLGERIVVSGRVLGSDGKPLRGQLVEIWQANAAGRYATRSTTTTRRSTRTSPAPGAASPTTTAGTGSSPSSRARTLEEPPERLAARTTSTSRSSGARSPSASSRRCTSPATRCSRSTRSSTRSATRRRAERLDQRFDLWLTEPDWALGFRWDIVARRQARRRRWRSRTMTELGITPSQTAGPYLRIGLFRTLVTPELVDPGRPAGDPHRGPAARRCGRRRARRDGRDLAGERAGRYRHPADDGDDVPLEDGFLGFGRSGTEDDGRFEF